MHGFDFSRGKLPTAGEVGADVVSAMESIEREHALPRSGVNSALTAHITLLFVAMLCLRTLASPKQHLGTVRASEFRRFREFVEQHFHKQHLMSEIARQLGIGHHRLHSPWWARRSSQKLMSGS